MVQHVKDCLIFSLCLQLININGFPTSPGRDAQHRVVQIGVLNNLLVEAQNSCHGLVTRVHANFSVLVQIDDGRRKKTA